MTLFSIIVPVYNVEAYLRECIDSILSQNYNDYELILVDDGSPDGCPAICDEYAEKDKRIKVIHKTNGGVVEARKAGVNISVGDYIVCVDGDDFVEQTYLFELSQIIDRHSPDIICCGHNEYRDGEKNAKHIMPPYGNLSKKDIEKFIYPILIEDKHGIYYPPSLWAKAFKIALYKEQQQIDSHIKIGEDCACTKSCIYYAESIYILDKCLYNYRLNPTSATKKPTAFPWDNPETVGKHLEAHIDMTQRDFQEQVYRFITHNLFIVACSQFNKDLPYKQIKKEIIENISLPYYRNAILNCQYRGYLKGKLAKFALKHKQIFFMYLYSKMLRRFSKK